ncbi:antirestriction protein ArdA [Escherichia coli]|nr:antirestriction protein ArdA [Escherichia coli]
MSVVAPAVYVGTWHKYNCGSIAGRWFDLTTFDDERDFFAACRALHQDEADPELMFQDYEGFPVNMASECHINWAWVEGFRQARDEGCEEAYRLWVDDTGETDFDTFRDAWWGEADSEEAIATESTEEVRFHYVFIDGYWKVMYRTPEGWKMKALALALRRCPK